jgi:uncharacterized protein with GYD domain
MRNRERRAMEHYLLRISYTSAGWKDILDKSPSFDQRMEPVRRLIAQLGGSFASFHFYDTPAFRGVAPSYSVTDKFAVFGGPDLMAVVAMPDGATAHALQLALRAQPGIRDLELLSMVPFEDVVTRSVAAAKSAVGTARYVGPGAGAP